MNALLIVDVQNDFLPGGALPVPDADKIIPVINKLIDNFDFVIATLDWHPANHLSFVSSHPGKKVGDRILVDGKEQVLWPVHCVQFTGGAFFAPGLNTSKIQRIFTKGEDVKIDSYSGFFDNARQRSTGLDAYLKAHQIKQLIVCGLATDFCVKATVLDAIDLGYKVIVVKDGCKAVNLDPGDEERAIRQMEEAGAIICWSTQLLK